MRYEVEVMKGYDFRTVLALICPNYDIQQDNDGQLVIYTGLMETEDDVYVPLTQEEEA